MVFTNYPLGDFLIRIKNAALARRKEVSAKNIKFVNEVAKVLKKEGIINDIKKEKDQLRITLAYSKKEPVLLDLKLVSKPGLRIYVDVDELEARRSPSYYIISTPKGILTSKEAIKNRVGGEVIAEIW